MNPETSRPTNRNKLLALVSILSALLLVAIIYIVILESQDDKTESSNINRVANQQQEAATLNNNSTVTQNSPSTSSTQNANTPSIPEGWSEHQITKCNTKFYLPSDWAYEESTSSDNQSLTIFLNSPQREKDLKSFGEGYPSLEISCYENVKSLINSTGNSKVSSNTDLTLEEALNIKNPDSDIYYNIFDMESKPEKTTLNNKEGYQGIQGGFGATLNRYFEHKGKIIEIITDSFNQETKELDPTDKQIQELIQFID